MRRVGAFYQFSCERKSLRRGGAIGAKDYISMLRILKNPPLNRGIGVL